MSPSLLQLCARIESHGRWHRAFATACATFRQWDSLVDLAEEQGLGPLLHRHLTEVGGEVPVSLLRGLRFLCLRHHQANAILMDALGQVLALLESAGLPCLVLKGAALCQTLYPESGLRPMRDIDLLLTWEDAAQAHLLLQKNGFRVSGDVLPERYFHLTPLVQNIEGMEVCVELHHGLFPADPPYSQSPPFGELYDRARPFEVAGVTAHSLADEEMLWHLYQHGFHAPLTYEPYRLIAVADIIGLVEARLESLDWDRIRAVYPQLYRILPLFDHISPWKGEVLEKISSTGGTVFGGAGLSFQGWPRSKFAKPKARGLVMILYNTFLPSRWWLMLYYGKVAGGWSLLWCWLVLHPMHILRWVKIYGLRSLREAKTGTGE